MKRHPTKSGKARIVLVDDHPLVRERLGLLINQQTDLQVCGECSEAAECLALVKEVPVDLAIVDLSLKHSHGFDLIKDLREQAPRLPVLVLSMHDEVAYAERALRAGARGYVTKQEATQTILSAIRRVLAGQVYVNEAMAMQLIGLFIHGYGRTDYQTPVARLTERELQIFELIGRGYQTKLIAENLGIDVKTIDTHRARLKEKLEVATVEELREAALRWVQRTPQP